MGVTMPHKEAIVGCLDELTDTARRIGSVNYVRRCGTGRLIGTNVDGSGFIQGLTSAGHSVQGRRALVNGVGGAGRAVAWALADSGVASLTLANRTASKAQALARQIQAAYPDTAVQAASADPADRDLVSTGRHWACTPAMNCPSQSIA